eukprot:358498_1
MLPSDCKTDSDDINEQDLFLPTTNKEEEHNNVLQETKKVANAFLISSFIGCISETMMLTTYILFAETMNNTSSVISLMVFLQSIGQIIGILITSYFSDKFGFDTLSIFTSTTLLIAVIVQSTSYNIIQFIFAVFLKGLVMDDIEILALGFFGTLLPINDAAVYTGLFYSLTAVASISGFIFSGLLIIFLNYRFIFIISTVIIFGRWIYILIRIRNQQNSLIKKQLQFMPYYSNNQIDENDVFPLCLEQT